jgi:glycosyltransferase involved in cell wall biosynthesis
MIKVVIPTYNELDQLSSLLPYLVDQSKEVNGRIVVADSPLSNDAVEVICKANEVQYIRCRHTGRAHQLNEGAQHQKMEAEILVFLHADVRPPVGFLKAIMKVVDEGKYKMGYFSYRFDVDKVMMRFNARFTRRKGLFSGGGDQMHFMTRACYELLGGYDERYSIMEDFDLMQRIKKQNIPYTIIDEPATVSSRKYKNNSWLKVNFYNLVAFSMFLLKMSPDRIKRFYTVK